MKKNLNIELSVRHMKSQNIIVTSAAANILYEGTTLDNGIQSADVQARGANPAAGSFRR